MPTVFGLSFIQRASMLSRIQALTSESAKSSQTYETLLSKEKEIAKLLDEKAAIVKEFDDLKGKFDEMMIDFTSLKNESVDLTVSYYIAFLLRSSI